MLLQVVLRVTAVVLNQYPLAILSDDESSHQLHLAGSVVVDVFVEEAMSRNRLRSAARSRRAGYSHILPDIAERAPCILEPRSKTVYASPSPVATATRPDSPATSLAVRIVCQVTPFSVTVLERAVGEHEKLKKSWSTSAHAAGASGDTAISS